MKHYSELLKDIKWLDLPIVTTNKKIQYLNIECAFDIETSSLKQKDTKLAFMYIWQIGIGGVDTVYYGRTWNELTDLLNQLSTYYELSESKRLVIYVHNLGYEFQFMRKYFTWCEGGVFSISERKPLKALCDLGIEFRCSYMLSGSSLFSVAKNLQNKTVSKLVGELDYSKVRHYKTELTEMELKYCENDVKIVLAYIKEQIEICGDITQIPLTNTGRVRKFVRDRCYKLNADGTKANKSYAHKYLKIMRDLTLTPEIYQQLKRAFMGGFTHANVIHSGKVLTEVTSVDFTSSYPSVMLAEQFPMSRFKDATVRKVSELENLCKKYCTVFDVEFHNLKPKIIQDNYISSSKCHELINPLINNGRVNSADMLSVTLTNVDYSIMKECYTWDYLVISNLRYAHKAYLPKPIIQSILTLYQDKTELKDVKGMEVEYLLSKGMLNSIYGMCVTDVVKDNALYDEQWLTKTPDIEDEISKYNESRNRFLYYAWGVWVTAYARRNLWSGILAVGDDYVYSDTDSLKLLNYSDHLEYVNVFNENIINKMRKMCDFYNLPYELLSPKTKDGITKTMGVWDLEGTYTRFKTLGAKRYLYQQGDYLQLTVAGLSKQNGLNYMKTLSDDDPIKLFDLFNNDLYIPKDKTGKMTHTYIDESYTFIAEDYKGEQCEITSLTGLHLEPCEFTLSISKSYLAFIEQLQNGYLFKRVTL